MSVCVCVLVVGECVLTGCCSVLHMQALNEPWPNSPLSPSHTECINFSAIVKKYLKDTCPYLL